MKIALRRPAPSPAPEERPAPPKPPRGRPVAQYAELLDGRRLWLAFDPEAGSAGLRDAATGEVRLPTAELTEDEPGWRAVRLDLDSLPWAEGASGAEQTAYELVLVGAGGRGARPFWIAPSTAPARVPARVPATGDGRHRHELRRTEDGALQVRRRALDPAVELHRVEVLADGVRLTLTASALPAELRLVADDGNVLAAYPASVADGTATVTLTADPLPHDVDVRTRVLVGTGDAALPVRRRADALPDPGRGAPLPAYESEAGPVLALRWSPDGLLTARVRPAEEGR